MVYSKSLVVIILAKRLFDRAILNVYEDAQTSVTRGANYILSFQLSINSPSPRTPVLWLDYYDQVPNSDLPIPDKHSALRPP